ncbi:MAG TPA: aldo/keto reductase [Anaerolineales bacterium]|nr:aldo/keto reductase [Anaerolineales bacterium]
MNYRRMGRTGLKLSEISLGAWITFGGQIDEATASALIHRAYESGVNFFDNADAYAHGQAEVVMGRAIRDLPRESLVISSKVFWPSMPGVNGRGLSRKHVFEACHASLKRLGLEYLDLYFCHRFDSETPLDETVLAMGDLVQQGKVLYWGTSEWRAAQIAEAHAEAIRWASRPPAVEQPHYNMLVRRVVESELAPAADTLGFGMVTWSPLRSGLLSGKYNESRPAAARLTRKDYDWLHEILTPENLEKSRALAKIASDLHVTQSQLCIGWLLRLPQVTSVITGATTLQQLNENLGAGDLQDRLTPEVLDRIESALGNRPVVEAA